MVEAPAFRRVVVIPRRPVGKVALLRYSTSMLILMFLVVMLMHILGLMQILVLMLILILVVMFLMTMVWCMMLIRLVMPILRKVPLNRLIRFIQVLSRVLWWVMVVQVLPCRVW